MPASIMYSPHSKPPIGARNPFPVVLHFPNRSMLQRHDNVPSLTMPFKHPKVCGYLTHLTFASAGERLPGGTGPFGMPTCRNPRSLSSGPNPK